MSSFKLSLSCTLSFLLRELVFLGDTVYLTLLLLLLLLLRCCCCCCIQIHVKRIWLLMKTTMCWKWKPSSKLRQTNKNYLVTNLQLIVCNYSFCELWHKIAISVVVCYIFHFLFVVVWYLVCCYTVNAVLLNVAVKFASPTAVIFFTVCCSFFQHHLLFNLPFCHYFITLSSGGLLLLIKLLA